MRPQARDQDPYPEVYPNVERPKLAPKGAVYTGNPARGGDRKGWVEVESTADLSKPQPPPPESGAWTSTNATVQVLVSAFRDELCGKTLFNLFTKAAFPNRVLTSVVQQNADGDVDCADRMCALLKDPAMCARRRRQVRIFNVPSDEAKGPVHARSMGSRMVEATSDFCMQTDSHMDFSPDWDLHLLKFWSDARNEYAVLSTYVSDLRQLGKCLNNVYEVPHLCQVIKSTGLVPRNSQAKAARMLKAPLLTTVWAAGLSFARCHFERRVPNDPNLPFVFDGEEFSRTLRGWTHGYDFYTPPRTVVGHNYNRQRKGHWQVRRKNINFLVHLPCFLSRRDVAPPCVWLPKMSDTSGGSQLANRRLQLLLGLPVATTVMPRRDASGHLGKTHSAEGDSESDLVTERAAVQRGRYGLGTRRTVTCLVLP